MEAAESGRPAPALGSSSGAARAVAATSCESIPAADVLHITQTQARRASPHVPAAAGDRPARSAQAETHAMLRTANEQLAAFNDESGIAYASLSARFTGALAPRTRGTARSHRAAWRPHVCSRAEHARTMSTLQTELMGVFKRVKAVAAAAMAPTKAVSGTCSGTSGCRPASRADAAAAVVASAECTADAIGRAADTVNESSAAGGADGDGIHDVGQR